MTLTARAARAGAAHVRLVAELYFDIIAARRKDRLAIGSQSPFYAILAGKHRDADTIPRF
jgi:hypothetical protein